MIALLGLVLCVWRYGSKNLVDNECWGAGFATGMVIGPLLTMLLTWEAALRILAGGCGMNGKIITAWAALAIIAASPTAPNAQTTAPNAQTTAPPEPRSCQRLHEETNKCDTGMRSCDQHVVARLEARCQRDEKRLPQVLGPGDGGRP